MALLERMAKLTVSDLNNQAYSPKQSVYRKLRNIVGRALGRSIRLPRYKYFWTTAILVDGLVEYSSEPGHKNYDNALIEYYKNSKNEKGFKEPAYVDEAMHGAGLLHLFAKYNERWMLEAAERYVHFLKVVHPKAGDGSLPYRSLNTDVVLVDTIGMVCPFLSNYADLFDDEEARELSVIQVKNFLKYGISKGTGLPYHGYKVSTLEKIGDEGWGRGVGWFLLGFTGCLAPLPKDCADYDILKEEISSLLERVFEWQSESGGFPAYFIRGEEVFDTGATAMIAYSCAVAIEKELVSREYLKNCINAYQYIINSTDSAGRVWGCSGEASGAGLYSTLFSSYPWGQGPAVALGSVISRLTDEER